MIKTSVYNLAIGMHVSKLDRVWMSISFFRRSFFIKNENQLKRLEAECEFVFFDPDKSKNTLLSPIDKTTTTKAIESASIEVSKTKNLLIKFFAKLQQGINLDTKSLILSISSLTNNVFNNTETYLYLAKLKEKDNSLSEKSIKVFIFYLAFAKHIGIKKDKLFEIGTAAILHDIGMLSVPEEFLISAFINKDERKYIQNHTNVGVEILSKENVFSKLTLRTIKHHNENLDGSGYTDGLKGRDISLYARMLNIICMKRLRENVFIKKVLFRSKRSEL
jgi:HD-GYP domain-containing protein (c-di-GMP phosphodiesterase class II)